MAIPFLIGAAVLAAAAVAASSNDKEQEEREEHARERAWQRERELEREAERRRAAARKEEQQRLERERQQRIRSFTASKLQALLESNGISTLQCNSELTESAIRNRTHCREVLLDAFEKSSAVKTVDADLIVCQQDIKSLEQLYVQLGD